MKAQVTISSSTLKIERIDIYCQGSRIDTVNGFALEELLEIHENNLLELIERMTNEHKLGAVDMNRDVRVLFSN
jgi:hypothetical protein